MTSSNQQAKVTVEVLHVPDCPNLAPMLEGLRQVTDIPAITRQVGTAAEAVALGMAGSPTLLINGVDPFTEGDSCECGISCRLYRDENNQLVPAPSPEQLRAALAAASPVDEPDLSDRSARHDESQVDVSSVALSAWRARAVPRDPVEQAVHQTILRSFAATGEPPSIDDLHQATGVSHQTLKEVLRGLHDGDAIRLDNRGQIAVAYPFSATPTRHRVRIADRVEVHAMCAIDALGIPAMLGQDVRIETTDPVTGDPITITNTDGRITWNPQDPVAFVGAAAGGGPSADCCCDYLNLFTSNATAQAWVAAHPSIPGDLLTRSEAEDLANTLFGALLPHNGAVQP